MSCVISWKTRTNLPSWTDQGRLAGAIDFNKKRGLYFGVLYGFASGMMSTVFVAFRRFLRQAALLHLFELRTISIEIPQINRPK